MGGQDLHSPRPAIKSLQEVQEAFAKLQKPLRNDSALHDFLAANFGQAGAELSAVPRDQLTTDAVFLDKVSDPVIREFVAKVMDMWPDLTRTYTPGTSNCSAAECPSSFIPVRRPFIVAGGRFREPYYWDSYWTLEGLLRTRGSFTEIARNTIENLLDMVESFGFVPNGARVYYLGRSQPPMLTQMVRLYMEHTGDAAVLERALPLLEREYDFWAANRSVDVESGGRTWSLARYAVSNTQPRPESFREDHEMATNTSYHAAASGRVFAETAPLGAARRRELYANLATAAESGWDFSSRWLARPQDAARDDYFPLRSLNGPNVVPVCLNSILYANERDMAAFYNQTGDDAAAARWEARAARRRDAVHALMWNATMFSYFDYNLTSRAHDVYVPADDDAAASGDAAGAPEGYQVLFHAAQLFPFWLGAAKEELRRPEAVLRAYAPVRRYLDARPGGIPATNYRTAQQWDQPGVWPPLMHPLIQGLLNAAPEPGAGPCAGPEPPQRRDVRALAVRLAQRYLDSAFCTWYATGGSTSHTPKLPGLTDADVGIMFEKYSDNSTNVAGGGGEYDVVEGFGWTNGVLIWAVDTFSAELKRPDCGDVEAANADAPAARRRSAGALDVDARDAPSIKMFGRR